MQTLEAGAGGPPVPASSGAVSFRVSGWRAVVRVLRSPRMLRSPVDDLIATAFPADCRHCDGPLTTARLVPVCDACLDHVAPSTLPACVRCGDGLDLGLEMEDVRFASLVGEGFLCRECRMAPPEFARAVAYGVYDGELRTLIHLLKFEGMRGLAQRLGPMLAEAVLSLEGVAAADLLVVAVPLFAARQRQRGFNQSVLLADAALTRLRRTRPDWKLRAAHGVLVRKRSTATQFELSRRGRRRNLRGAFAVTGDVGGREILLVDDILTSGATARECARVLMAAGAAKVWVATVARAQKRSVLRAFAEPEEMVARWDMPVALVAVSTANTEILAAPE